MASGRKRKSGARQPNGQLSRAVANREPESRSPAAIKRLIDSDIRGAHSAMYGTPIGRLMLEDKIDLLQYQAALAWASLAQKRARALDLPSPDIRSPSLEPRSPGASLRAGQSGQIWIVRFDAILADLRLAGHSARAVKTMRECCEGLGRYPAGYEELRQLQAILQALGAILTKGSAPARNALSGRAGKPHP